MSLWHQHPGVRHGKDLTTGERAADLVRNGMGSWPFVFAFLGFMAVWAGFNGGHGFDPYPFILLNLFLSNDRRSARRDSADLGQTRGLDQQAR